jgi:hypothetical protein
MVDFYKKKSEKGYVWIDEVLNDKRYKINKYVNGKFDSSMDGFLLVSSKYYFAAGGGGLTSEQVITRLKGLMPVAVSIELIGSAEAAGATSGTPYGGILALRGPDRLKYKGYAAGGLGGGFFGASAMINPMTYYYIGDIEHFNLSIFSGISGDAEFSFGEGVVVGANITAMSHPRYPNEYLIGIGLGAGFGAGSPFSWSITTQGTVFFNP